jgi:hypothetical protein
MTHFRRCWDAEKNNFILKTKGMGRAEALAMFRAAFPYTDITDTAFFNQRSRLHAGNRASHHSSRKARPLYSEQEKKGYVRIKIAQPSVWIMKSKWVYMETHPWEDFSEKSNYIFLDGNTRNFAPDNIERVPLKLMGIFCELGGTVDGAPELTRINILRAKLKVAELDALEKHGKVSNCGKKGRVDRDKLNARARAAYQRNKKEISERRRKWYYEHHDEVLAYMREQRRRAKEAGGTK